MGRAAKTKRLVSPNRHGTLMLTSFPLHLHFMATAYMVPFARSRLGGRLERLVPGLDCAEPFRRPRPSLILERQTSRFVRRPTTHAFGHFHLVLQWQRRLASGSCISRPGSAMGEKRRSQARHAFSSTSADSPTRRRVALGYSPHAVRILTPSVPALFHS
jgi:hypothetical protein